MNEVDYSLDGGYFDFSLETDSPCRLKLSLISDAAKKSTVSEGEAVVNRLPNPAQSKKKKKVQTMELTEEMKKDLEVIKMRSVFDPKHFYKKDKTIGASKNIQIGEVIDSPADFYSSRVPKKMRKRTLVDQLLADAEFKKRNKNKYLEIIQQKQRTHSKAAKIARRLKKRNKR